MKVNANNLRPAVDKRVIVVYGESANSNKTTSTLISTFKSKYKNLAPHYLNYSEANHNFPEFAPKLFNLDLTGEISLFIIKNTPANITKAWQELLIDTAKSSPHFLLLHNSELAPSSALRKLAESNKDIAIIPCYQLNDQQQRQYLTRQLSALNGINTTPDVISFLSSTLPLDPGIIDQELNKIVNFLDYNDSNRSLDLKSAIELTIPSNEQSFDRILQNLLTSSPAKLSDQFEQIANSSLSSVGLVRMMIRNTLRLQQVAAEMQGGATLEAAIKTLSPPLFFTSKTSFVQQLRGTNYHKLCQLLKVLFNTEANLKAGTLNQKIVLGDLARAIKHHFSHA